ncbi:uncharacterized protein LOC143153202 [Ptiloglossa arizonensis]|uniref:uncharacterized protein LOC143153202 n=1 Tax=Ptiloglossa arizonensis TaxID=3350558 RepID=UPI003F9FC3F9
MADNIGEQLEEAARNLKEEAIECGKNYREIRDDLMNIQEQIQLIWDKIKTSTDYIFAQHEGALIQYEQTVQKLAQMNETIQSVWNITNTMRVEVDQKLNWLTSYIGDTGEEMRRMYSIGLHIIYLMGAMIVTTFLHAPLLPRIIIMGIVSLNLALYLKHGIEVSLSFTTMTALIFFIITMHFLMVGVQRIFASKMKKVQPEPVQVINQNGHASSIVREFVSSSNPNVQTSQIYSKSLYLTLKKKMWKLYNVICSQMNRCIPSWGRQNIMQHEELSCSYVSSKKFHEDLIFDYEQELPNMSDDITDFENSVVTNQRNDSTDDLNSLLDASELRIRLRRLDEFIPSSKSVSSTSEALSVQSKICISMKRNGTRCRKHARPGYQLCKTHERGTSIMSN